MEQMNIIITKRGGGKTTLLIDESSRTQATIVCCNMREAQKVQELAEKMGCTIPTPITYSSFKLESYRGSDITGFLIDNADMFVQSFTTIPVKSISISTTK